MQQHHMTKCELFHFLGEWRGFDYEKNECVHCTKVERAIENSYAKGNVHIFADLSYSLCK